MAQVEGDGACILRCHTLQPQCVGATAPNSHLCHLIALQRQALEAPLHIRGPGPRHLTAELYLTVSLHLSVEQTPYNGHFRFWGMGQGDPLLNRSEHPGQAPTLLLQEAFPDTLTLLSCHSIYLAHIAFITQFAINMDPSHDAELLGAETGLRMSLFKGTR